MVYKMTRENWRFIEILYNIIIMTAKYIITPMQSR